MFDKVKDARQSNELGEYLRARRGLVLPEDVGLSAHGRRRVPGLRREEVALLAGISADYYLRLERGRDVNPSEQVLNALGRVLQLDEIELTHLLGLTTPRLRQKRFHHVDRVPDRIQHLLSAVHIPAFVENRYFDVLASNSLATALSPRLGSGENRLWSLFLDPEEREFHTDWEGSVASFAAAARHSLGRAVNEPRAVERIGQLSLASARFR